MSMQFELCPIHLSACLSVHPFVYTLTLPIQLCVYVLSASKAMARQQYVMLI